MLALLVAQGSDQIALGWVPTHRGVDLLLHAAALVLLAFVFLGGLSAGVYSLLFLIRLLKRSDVANFLRRPIPSRISGRIAGAGVDISDELAQVLPAFEHQTTQTLAGLEARLSKVENQLDLWEDVTGQA